MVVHRASKLGLIFQVYQVSKARKESLGEVVRQVVEDSKETEVLMVSRAEMDSLALRDCEAFPVQTDDLDFLEVVEMMVCLVCQEVMVHLVRRVEMEVEALLGHLESREDPEDLVHLGRQEQELVQDHLGRLAILGHPVGLEDPGRLEGRVILASLEIQGGKDNQENLGLDSKDCRVIRVTEDVLAYQV